MFTKHKVYNFYLNYMCINIPDVLHAPLAGAKTIGHVPYRVMHCITVTMNLITLNAQNVVLNNSKGI